MYQSQVRSNTGRKLAVQQSTQQIQSNSLSSSFLLLLSSLSKRAEIRCSAMGALMACLVPILSGCGGLVYRSNGSPSGASGSTTPAALAQVSCGTQSLTGPQTKGCSVYLSASALSPTVVYLKSSNSALAVPSAVTVLVGAQTTGFNAVSSGVSKSVTVTITGSSGGVNKTDAITLYPAQSAAATLSKISCGTQTLTGPTTKGCSVYLDSAATSSTTVVLKSSSANLQVPAFVTVASGAMSAGFGATATAVSSNQTVTLTATASGVSQSEVIQLTSAGTQTATQHKVQLNWQAPAPGSVAVAGYRVYRALQGSGYQLLNSAIDVDTTYTDTAVQSGDTYDYIVKSVDASGTESAGSNSAQVTIP